MHSKGYSNHCSLIRLHKGKEMDLEVLNSPVDIPVGSIMPKPPCLGGRPRRSCSLSFGGDLPVREGMKFEQMQFSSGCKWPSMLGMVLHRNVNLCTYPCVKAA